MIVYLVNERIKNMEDSRFKVGDTIYWYCDAEQCVHHAKVLFVNKAGAGYPDTNYEVKTFCCGEDRTVFVDEYDAMTSDIFK